jgi:hypothetical protein
METTEQRDTGMVPTFFPRGGMGDRVEMSLMKRYSLGIVLLLMVLLGAPPAQGKELGELRITIVHQTPATHAESLAKARDQLATGSARDLPASPEPFPGKPASVPDELKGMISEFPLLASPQEVLVSGSKPPRLGTADYRMSPSQMLERPVVVVIVTVPVNAASGSSVRHESPEYQVLVWSPGAGDSRSVRSPNFLKDKMILVEMPFRREPAPSITVLGLRIENGEIYCEAPVD